MGGRNGEKGKSEEGWIISIDSKVKSTKEQLIKEKAASLKRSKNRVKQCRQSKFFLSNQSKFYQKLDGKSHEENIILDNEKN